MSKSALKFGTAGLFGSMGGNQMINSLTNANALAAQQAAAQQAAASRATNTMGGGGMNDYSQPIMTGNLDPMTQQIGLGMFGGINARQRALAGSGLMKHTDQHLKRQAKKKADETGGDEQEIYYEMKSDQMEKEKKKGDPDEEKAKRDESMSRGAQGEIN
ncbi:MAG: hypothetical protein CBC27_08430 [Opitutia bacterium TMED67]|nr:MAG: hypothetical protein CBC27_08430 [Opitutae bacterium TMED67]|tara:strand:+ start:594 stop:1073 length:480 start_codon:yes stop_codon:yes gene_type:complete